MTAPMVEFSGYRINKIIGQGGMATVYSAIQESFGRTVALKVLSGEKSQDQDFAARFIREARLVASLSHPHIIPVYDVGQEHGFIYISMEHLTGGDLAQWIPRGLEPEETLQIVEQIALALQYAHSKGVTHRDIKPDNIMFREDNSAVLTDFGIARHSAGTDQVTQAGLVIGTPKYMSPEQLRGNDIDGRCDLYALGVVLYEMLCKQAPYRAEEFTALCLQHINDPLPQLPIHLHAFQPMLDKLMAKQPQDRFQSGREVAKAVQQLREQLRTPAKPKSRRTAPPAPTSSDALTVEGTTTAADTASIPNLNTRKSTAKQNAAPTKPNISNTFSNNQSGTVDAVKQGIEYVEKRKSLLGLMPRYTLQCHIGTPDAHTFGIQFSGVTTHLLEWYQRRKGKTKAIEFIIATHPMAFGKIKSTIQALVQAGGPYHFLSKAVVSITLYDQHQQQQEYVCL